MPKKRPIPADTEYFHYYNANPKGKRTTDCVVRAICTALSEDYNSCLREMVEITCKTGYMFNENNGENKYLKSKGWVKQKQPKKYDNTKYTAQEFCKWLDIWAEDLGYGETIIAHCGSHHVVCIKKHNGKFKVWDTWNSSRGKIGVFFTKEGE